MPIQIVEEAALRAAVSAADAVRVIRDAFHADGHRRTHVPPVINLDLPAVRGEFHVKTALIEGIPHMAVKVASGFYDNPLRGLPSGSGLIALFDAATGMPVALRLDNAFLTDIRTGAAGAVAADVLAAVSAQTSSSATRFRSARCSASFATRSTQAICHATRTGAGRNRRRTRARTHQRRPDHDRRPDRRRLSGHSDCELCVFASGSHQIAD